MSSRPSHNDFIATCREHFAYLESEFGFRELPTSREYNQFSIRWRNGERGVDVYGEEYGARASCDLLVGMADDLHLSLLVPVSERKAPEIGGPSSGQLEQVKRLAELLRAHARDFLDGDRTRFYQALKEWRRATKPKPYTADERAEKELRVAAAEAGHAFRRSEFGAVVQLLESYERQLSPHQRTLLEVARARLGGMTS